MGRLLFHGGIFLGTMFVIVSICAMVSCWAAGLHSLVLQWLLNSALGMWIIHVCVQGLKTLEQIERHREALATDAEARRRG